ncbi:MAG: DegT/DnrJ/EryC1/StrS family aminotransferase [Opitutaceae bacterium]|nr:DegT/DnrJ/EryC1/StrS family aminotransferase [Opitutaceae bacterium]
MHTPASRRNFLGCAASAAVVASLARVSAAESQSTATAPRAASGTDWPLIGGTDEKALIDVLRSGRWGRTSGGARNREFETVFAQRMQAKHCIATSSGTTALLTALGALNIGPGDEVVLPPYTFVATFNAITASFALPVFADTDPATLQIDAQSVAAAISPATRLLLPVHIGGTAADLDALATLARARNLPLIEDACQAPLAEWNGRPVGTHGLGGCFSFQAGKNLTAGEGGAVVTNDDDFAHRCYNFHTPGGGKPAPSLGRGANFRLTEFQAALLLSQWTRFEAQQKERADNAAHLSRLLAAIPGIAPAKLTPGNTRNGWHLYMFRYDAAKFAGLPRAKFLHALAKEGVAASAGYTALNLSPHVQALAKNPHYRRIYGDAGMAQWLERNRCPANDRVVEETVWLGQAKLLGSRASMERIAEKIADIQKRAGQLARA